MLKNELNIKIFNKTNLTYRKNINILFNNIQHGIIKKASLAQLTVQYNGMYVFCSMDKTHYI